MIDMMIEDIIGMTDIGIENLEITVLDIIDSETEIINLITQEMAVHIDLMIVHSMDLKMLVPVHNIGPLLDPHPLVFIGVKIIVSHFCGGKLKLDRYVHVKTCAVCNRNKKGLKHHHAPLSKYHAGAPLDRVHIDILGPITTSENGNHYVLMLVDQFTKWLECWPLPNQTAEIVASRVVKGFISKFGCPL